MQVSAPVMALIVTGEIPHPPGEPGAVPALGSPCCLHLSLPLPCGANLVAPGLLPWPSAGLCREQGWSCLSNPPAWSCPLGTALPSPAPSSCHVSGSTPCPHCTHSLALKCTAAGKRSCSTSGGGIGIIISM